MDSRRVALVEMLERKISQVYTNDVCSYGLSGSGASTEAHVTMTFLKVIKEDQVMFGNQPKERSTRFWSEATYTRYTTQVPNPTCRRPEISKSVTPSVRRRSRYDRAEQSLVLCSMQVSSEPSPEELKIRILEEAIAHLSTYAREAQESVVRLRKRLADRSMEPEGYQSLQKERWREERRRVVLEQKAKVAQAELACLSRGDVSEHPKVDRRTANLISFLDRSTTKAPLQFKSSPSFELKTMTQVSPLSLRPIPPPKRVPIAPLSIKAFPRPREPLYARRNQPQKLIITTVYEDEPLTPFPAVSLATTETGFTPALSPTSLNDDDVNPGDGFAYIHSPTGQRSKADVMADLDSVPIPDYAVHLLRDFEHRRDEISLSDLLPSPFFDSRISSEHSSPLHRSLVYGKLFPKSIETPINPSPDKDPLSPHYPFPQSKSSFDSNDRRHAPTFSLGSFFVRGQLNKRTDHNLPFRHSLHELPIVVEEEQDSWLLLKRHPAIDAIQSSVIVPVSPEHATGKRGRGPALISRMKRSLYRGRD